MIPYRNHQNNSTQFYSLRSRIRRFHQTDIKIFENKWIRRSLNHPLQPIKVISLNMQPIQELDLEYDKNSDLSRDERTTLGSESDSNSLQAHKCAQPSQEEVHSNISSPRCLVKSQSLIDASKEEVPESNTSRRSFTTKSFPSRRGKKLKKAIHLLPKGEKFWGIIKEGKKEGHGIQYLSNGQVIKGHWKDGKLKKFYSIQTLE